MDQSDMEALERAYRVLSDLQSSVGENVIKTMVYPPTMETLETAREHGYVLEAMTAVLRVIKCRKGKPPRDRNFPPGAAVAHASTNTTEAIRRQLDENNPY